MAERVHHNHVTRDVKAVGKCPACDLIRRPKAEIAEPLSAATLTAIEARVSKYEKSFPWRLLDGAKDFIPRDRALLLAEVHRLRGLEAAVRSWTESHRIASGTGFDCVQAVEVSNLLDCKGDGK